MDILRDEIRCLIASKNPESFFSLSEQEKKSLAIEAIKDSENFDLVEVFLYRDDSFKTILNKKLTGQMTDEQVVKRIFEILVEGTANGIEEIMDDIRSDMLLKRIEDTL